MQSNKFDTYTKNNESNIDEINEILENLIKNIKQRNIFLTNLYTSILVKFHQVQVQIMYLQFL